MISIEKGPRRKTARDAGRLACSSTAKMHQLWRNTRIPTKPGSPRLSSGGRRASWARWNDDDVHSPPLLGGRGSDGTGAVSRSVGTATEGSGGIKSLLCGFAPMRRAADNRVFVFAEVMSTNRDRRHALITIRRPQLRPDRDNRVKNLLPRAAPWHPALCKSPDPGYNPVCLRVRRHGGTQGSDRNLLSEY